MYVSYVILYNVVIIYYSILRETPFRAAYYLCCYTSLVLWFASHRHKSPR